MKYKFVPGSRGIISRDGSYTMTKTQSNTTILVNKHNILITSLPSDKQFEELKKLVLFYSDSYIKLFIANDRNDEQYVIKFNSVYETVLFSQIMLFFNEGIVPVGNDNFSEKSKDISNIIYNERLSLNEATDRYNFYKQYGLYDNYDNISFDAVVSEKFVHNRYDDYISVFESGGVVKRFNNIIKNITQLVYDNYYSTKSIETNYVFNGTVKRLPNEPEESFINRCCDLKDNHKHINNGSEVIDNGWHHIMIHIFTNSSSFSKASTGRIMLDAYHNPTNINNRTFLIKILENDNIMIFINRIFVPRDKRLIASELQHELVHTTDNYSSLKYHLKSLRAKISSINDIFNIKEKYSKLYKEVLDICALASNSEQVAYANAGYRYIMETELDDTQIQDINHLINISSSVTNAHAMNDLFSFIDEDDMLNKGYVYNPYNHNIRKIIKVLLIAFYMKKHNQIEWKKFNSECLSEERMSEIIRLVKECADSEDEFEELSLKSLHIDFDEYVSVRDFLKEYLEKNREEYMNKLKFILIEALRDKGFRKYVDIDRKVRDIKKRVMNN